jgi:cysteine desulfurase
MNTVYLDNYAATPLHPKAKEAMHFIVDNVFGNPSSDHRFGQAAAEALDRARTQTAALLNAAPQDIVFTSGGTESVNQAIKGVAFSQREKGRHIITTNIEHKSVLNTLRTLRMVDFKITSLDVDHHGLVDPAAVEKAITDETILITIQMANNEIGTIQPIAEIGKIAKARKVTFHTDAVAAAGIIPINMKELDVDLLSLSANQFNGPNGVGALYIRRGTGIWPLIEGGVQENRKRAGTENVVGIVGLGLAAEMARVEMPERLPKLRALRQKLIQGLKDRIPHLVFNGHPTQVLPHLVSVSVEFIEGEGLMLLMDEEGVCVATRSACASGSLRASHVLIGTGMDFGLAQGTLLITFGRDNTEADVDRLLEVMPKVVETLRAMSPTYQKSASN